MTEMHDEILRWIIDNTDAVKTKMVRVDPKEADLLRDIETLVRSQVSGDSVSVPRREIERTLESYNADRQLVAILRGWLAPSAEAKR